MSAAKAPVEIEIVKTVDQTLIDSLRRLYRQLYPNTPQSAVEAAVGFRALDKLVGSDSDRLLVAKTADGRIVGTATLNLVYRIGGRFATIESLVVDSDCRRRGLGRLLVDQLVELARDGGACLISLVSGQHRPASHRLYEAAGFRRRPNLYYSLWLDRPGP